MNMVRKKVIKQSSAGMKNTRKLAKAKQGSFNIIVCNNGSHAPNYLEKEPTYLLSHSLWLDEQGIIELIQ